jgi:hypothetical protein
MYLSHPDTCLKFRRGRNRAVTLAAIHEQPFPLHNYCVIGDPPPIVTSEAQINEGPTRQGQDCKTTGL